MWVGIIQSAEGLNGKKTEGKEIFPFFPISLLELGHFTSSFWSLDWVLCHWLPNSTLIRPSPSFSWCKTLLDCKHNTNPVGTILLSSVNT